MPILAIGCYGGGATGVEVSLSNYRTECNTFINKCYNLQGEFRELANKSANIAILSSNWGESASNLKTELEAADTELDSFREILPMESIMRDLFYETLTRLQFASSNMISELKTVK